jgi:hypothetical protein
MNRVDPATTAADRLPHRRFQPFRQEQAVEARRAARWPAGMLGMLALVAAIEAALEGAGPRFHDQLCDCWALSARAARTEAPSADILVLGDSLAKHGLVPRVLNEVTGRRAYSLATPAAPAAAAEALLRRALDAGARPSAVVFDLKQGLLLGSPHFSLKYWPQVLSPLGAVRLAVELRKGAHVGELLAGMTLPSFRYRHEVRGDLLCALQGQTSPWRSLNALGRRHWAVNDGAHLATPRPSYDGVVSEDEHWTYMSRGFEVHRANRTYARRLVALAESSGARAYLLLPPMVPQLSERRLKTGAEAKYEAFIRTLQDEFPGLTVLDGRSSGYPPSAFIDPVHLNARGALAVSEGVGSVLRRDLDGRGPVEPRRWVRLPDYHDKPLPDWVEHVELSRARLGAAVN